MGVRAVTDQPPASDRLLTLAEVAAQLHISERTLQRMNQRGDGPRFVQIGRKRRWRQEAVAEYIANAEGESRADSVN